MEHSDHSGGGDQDKKKKKGISIIFSQLSKSKDGHVSDKSSEGEKRQKRGGLFKKLRAKEGSGSSSDSSSSSESSDSDNDKATNVEKKSGNAGKIEKFFEKAEDELRSIVHRHNRDETSKEEEKNKSDQSSENAEGTSLMDKTKHAFHAVVHPDRDHAVKVEHSKSGTDAHGEGLKFLEKVKGKLEVGHGYHHHRGESHGTSGVIDAGTPIGEVKAPNLFERGKEEVEAIIDSLKKKPSKESTPTPPPPLPPRPPQSEDCCVCTLAKGLQQVCLGWTGGSNDCKKKD